MDPQTKSPNTFPILAAQPRSSELSRHDTFTVSTFNGFLPITAPLVDLPPSFAPLASLLERMPIRTLSGAPGLLAHFSFGVTVQAELLDLSAEVDVEVRRGDRRVLSALFRDYCFLTSAYLLEPCYERKSMGLEGYGLGRQSLPAQVARPLVKLAEALGHKPFMEYASSYALYNWRLEDPKKGMEYTNLRLIRAFEHGLDSHSSEAGFVLTHVDMVKHSGTLVRAAMEALDGCEKQDRQMFNDGLRTLVEGMKEVNAVMESMWKRSKPNDYNSFRTFIFGITKQSMFPNGVLYEGIREEPMSFRGESGSNDSIIPLCDNLLGIIMPDTPLTEILKDFRSYRPYPHRDFLEWVKERAENAGLKNFAMNDEDSADWCFTREYIIKRTSHPTATGGSPIVLWLPNQLFSVYDHMINIGNDYPKLPGCHDIMDIVYAQRKTLVKEVQRYCTNFSAQDIPKAPSPQS
ncbi:MAG: hypothetical protein Q9163_001249 [Psora crenata]